MKKFRSKLPRRKRERISPILRSSPATKIVSNSVGDSVSNLTREVEFSCDNSSTVSTNNNSVKKRSFAVSNDGVAGEFRRITRSYSKQRQKDEKNVEVEQSESSSCVESISSSTKCIIRKRLENLKTAKSENDVVSVIASGIENSEVTERSEISFTSKNLAIGGEKLKWNEENDVVSVTSRLQRPQEAKSSEKTVDGGQTRVEENSGQRNLSGSTTKCAPKLISVDFDLTCSENFSSEEDEECDYSSVECTDTYMESSEIEFSSEYTPSTWYESGSQFSERSAGDTTPSPTFQLFLLYSQQFCKSEFSKVSSSRINDEPSEGVIKLLRPEDEEHEESYHMLRKRERRQVYLHDYAEEYCGSTEFGQLVVQQRLHMVHWIVEQSASKEFQKETMFLGVSLLDRFLSKGYFKNKRNLQIAGIACLSLATRIEENQPFNSIQQKSFKMGSNEYSRCEVVAMEWLVQEVLNFQCFLPTIYNFLWFYIRAARVDEGVEKTARYLAVLALLGHEQLCYWPSTVAAGLVILACVAANEHSSRQQIGWIYDGSNDSDLPDCIKSLEWLVKYIC